MKPTLLYEISNKLLPFPPYSHRKLEIENGLLQSLWLKKQTGQHTHSSCVSMTHQH